MFNDARMPTVLLAHLTRCCDSIETGQRQLAVLELELTFPATSIDRRKGSILRADRKANLAAVSHRTFAEGAVKRLQRARGERKGS